MTDNTVIVSLSLTQVDGIMDALVNAAAHFDDKATELKRVVGVYDMSLFTVDQLADYERRRDTANQQWVQFYQLRKVLREGGAA